MARQNEYHLNQTLKSWPSRAICLSDWFNQHGVSRKLVHYYNKAGWIEKIGQGAYKKAAEKVDWPSGLQAIQDQAELSIHLGGKSALQFQGFSHYVSMGKSPILIYGASKNTLPAWFKRYQWTQPITYITTNLFGLESNIGIKNIEIDGIQLKGSSLERAIMELIYLIPNRQSYEEAYQIMGSLTTLRPELVQTLLENCTSIKVKRVFMVLAKKYNYPWFELIDKAKIDFGKGKRELIKGGTLEPEYLITVPLDEDQNDIEV